MRHGVPSCQRLRGASAGRRGNRAVRSQLVQPCGRRAREGILYTSGVRGILFLGRIHDPMKQWKLSPMDLESRRRWEDYTKAKEVMLERSHIPEARGWVVQAVWSRRSTDPCDCVAAPPVGRPANRSA